MSDPSPADAALRNLLEARIRERGPIPFSEFMEAALYHPEHGYYARHAAPPDYYTGADVHPVFGAALARFFRAEWENRLDGKDFHLVELGPGPGKLAGAVLQALQEQAPECFERLTYTAMEVSPARRQALEALRERFPSRVRIEPAFNFAERSLRGIVFSNEFFDALPFRRVVKTEGGLKEIFVGEGLKETPAEPAHETRDFFDWLGLEPAESCEAEATLAARGWMERIGRALEAGTVLTIDYGYPAAQLFSDLRPQGTALCHFQHRTNCDFYARLGEQDITAHANFTVLERAGQAHGLRADPLQTQSHFLLENGLEDFARTMERTQADPRARLKTSSAIKSLIHPEGMGGTFKVLVQRKKL